MEPEDIEKYLNKYMSENIEFLEREYSFKAKDRYFKQLRTNQFKPEMKQQLISHKQEIRKIMG